MDVSSVSVVHTKIMKIEYYFHQWRCVWLCYLLDFIAV